MSRKVARYAYPAAMAGLLFLAAQSSAHAASAIVKDVRVGEHPDATRIVLDLSQRTNASFDVSQDGRTLVILMPNAEWHAGNFAAKHAQGLLTNFRQTVTPDGLQLSLQMTEPVRMKPPFFVSPDEGYGERVVIDIVPDPALANAAHAAPQIAAAPVVAMPKLAAVAPAAVQPSDIAMEQRMVAGPANIVPPVTAPVQVAQTAYKLSPSAAAPVQTAQAVPPQTPSSQGMQPMADNSSYGGLLYVKAAAGLGVREEANIEGNGQTAAVESDFGWVGNAGLGLDLRNNFRLEGEILYTKNNAKSVTGSLNNTPVNSAEGVGDVSLLGFMGNIAYDFNTAYAITPFIFGGAGIAKVSVNGVGTTGNTINDSDTVFAMQGGAGLSTDLTDRTSFDLSYRYLETLDAKLADSTGVPINYTYQDHMIMLGLHYKL